MIFFELCLFIMSRVATVAGERSALLLIDLSMLVESGLAWIDGAVPIIVFRFCRFCDSLASCIPFYFFCVLFKVFKVF